MNIAVFTSMNQSYYEKCGYAMLSSYNKYWKNTFPLYLYNEDNFKPEENFVNLMGWNLGKDYLDFQERTKNHKVKTFAKKGFSIIHAMENIKCDRLIWLDADTIIKDFIDKSFINDLCPDKNLSTHFSVYHIKDYVKYHSCETGFFILNKRHKGFEKFKNTYKDIYINTRKEGLRRFYDGEIYGKTVELMAKDGHKITDLNTGGHKTPMPRSVVAPYIAHHKAGLKDRVNYKDLS